MASDFCELGSTAGKGIKTAGRIENPEILQESRNGEFYETTRYVETEDKASGSIAFGSGDGISEYLLRYGGYLLQGNSNSAVIE